MLKWAGDCLHENLRWLVKKRQCVDDKLEEGAWLPRLKAMIPTYGIDLKEDAAACQETRAETAPILKIETV